MQNILRNGIIYSKRFGQKYFFHTLVGNLISKVILSLYYLFTSLITLVTPWTIQKTCLDCLWWLENIMTKSKNAQLFKGNMYRLTTFHFTIYLLVNCKLHCFHLTAVQIGPTTQPTARKYVYILVNIKTFMLHLLLLIIVIKIIYCLR